VRGYIISTPVTEASCSSHSSAPDIRVFIHNANEPAVLSKRGLDRFQYQDPDNLKERLDRHFEHLDHFAQTQSNLVALRLVRPHLRISGMGASMIETHKQTLRTLRARKFRTHPNAGASYMRRIKAEIAFKTPADSTLPLVGEGERRSYTQFFLPDSGTLLSIGASMDSISTGIILQKSNSVILIIETRHTALLRF